ncbi:antibiotic biosynthesis monooxygenase [Halalkalibaculum roseum]|nr:antibiotic biosynthesis monooxygenase [Halalkalibaculum roseum]
MVMRLVEAKIAPELLNDFKVTYRDKIIPVLEDTTGCLFAGLLQSLSKSEQLVSLTLWQSKKNAQKYVDSGTFQKNLDLVNPYIEESSEWKIQLSKEHILNYERVKQEPRIKSYNLNNLDDKSISEEIDISRNYLRVLSLNLVPGKEKDFKRIYYHEIQPELKKVSGCRYSFLIDNTEDGDEILSFTIWDDLQSVRQYEKLGKFQSLLEKIQHTLDELYQWKMALEKQEKATVAVSSRDIDVSKFTLVTGKRFT